MNHDDPALLEATEWLAARLQKPCRIGDLFSEWLGGCQELVRGVRRWTGGRDGGGNHWQRDLHQARARLHVEAYEGADHCMWWRLPVHGGGRPPGRQAHINDIHVLDLKLIDDQDPVVAAVLLRIGGMTIRGARIVREDDLLTVTWPLWKDGVATLTLTPTMQEAVNEGVRAYWLLTFGHGQGHVRFHHDHDDAARHKKTTGRSATPLSSSDRA